jgi:hypothetical protein
MEYFSEKKQKIDAWRASSKKIASTLLVGYSLFGANS